MKDEKKKISFADLILIDLCWILFSLPVVTAGISSIAAIYVLNKKFDGKECSIWNSFTKTFKTTWKQGLVLWFVTLIIAFFAYLVFNYFKNDFAPSTILMLLSILAFIVFTGVIVLSFPMAAHYENNAAFHLRNSLLLSFRFAKKVIVLDVVFAILCVILTVSFLNKKILLVPEILILPLVFFYIQSSVSRKLFATIDKENAEALAKQQAQNEEAQESDDSNE